MISFPVFPALTVSDMPSDLLALVEELSERDPSLGLSVARAFADVPPSLRAAVEAHFVEAVERDRRMDADVDAMVSRAHAAQQLFENWTEERVDHLLHDLAKAFAARAQEYAELTVQQTRIGSVRDKTIKNRFASLGVYDSLAGKVAQGPLATHPDRQVTELASPVGVVFAVVPVTNPVATAIFKTLIALKARNALIMSFHHDALGLAGAVGAAIRYELQAHGAPSHLVQWIEQRGSRRMTRKYMTHPKVSLILATGGAGLVRAAYSSGKPAIGVGPGNGPALVCRDADPDRAARAVVTSKSFDHGLICGAEHNLVVDDRVVDSFVGALARAGAAVLTPAETESCADALVDAARGTVKRAFVGQSADSIAAALGIVRDYPIRVLIVKKPFVGVDDPYAREKLAPVLSLFTVSGEDEGLRLCRSLLNGIGAGHTAAIHTTNAARVERFARAMPAGRILVNTPSAQGCCGITTGLDCSLTLGCGTFGGNSTTDNVTYRHLLNIKRVAADQSANPGARRRASMER